MKDFSGHIGIIGAGISGLALGCFLKKANIPVVIFEKSNDISEHGAGISLSPNGLRVLKALGIYKKIQRLSGNPNKAYFFSNNKKVTSFPVDVITTSRQTLYKSLLDNYLSYDGDILFNHELLDLDVDSLKISFSNGNTFNVSHLVACDGIRSICRKYHDKIDSEPSYSGYSVWRAIIDKKQENIETYLGPNHHIVTYPIDKNRTSFVAAIKTNKMHKESWRSIGTKEEMLKDLPKISKKAYSFLDTDFDLYKWGVYTRSNIKSLYMKNVTFLGDAAHPIVPVMGQGGCLALEDAFVFSELVSKFKNDFSKIQYAYEKIRLKRIKKIKARSEIQGYLNHIKNPFLVLCRNLIMKFFPIIPKIVKDIWDYDSSIEINNIKQY
jgi:salicylate hydroxylase